VGWTIFDIAYNADGLDTKVSDISGRHGEEE